MNINFCTIDATVCRINKELVIKGASDIHTSHVHVHLMQIKAQTFTIIANY